MSLTSPSIAADIFKKYGKQTEETSDVEKTLAIIKPDGMKYRDKILQRIALANFVILQKLYVKLSAEQASEFYKSLYGKPLYPIRIAELTEGPIIIMCLSKVKAISYWQILMGPENVAQAKRLFPGSLRAKFGDPKSQYRNLFHGSENSKLATYEIRFFFPEIILEPILSTEEQFAYIQEHIYPILFDGLYEVTKLHPDEPIIWLAKWLLENNPNKPLMYKRNQIVMDKICCMEREIECPNLKPCPDEEKNEIICCEVEESKNVAADFPDFIGKCLKCPHCNKYLRVVYDPKDNQQESSNTTSDSIQCSFQSSSINISNIEDKETINCMGCNKVFVIRTNLYDAEGDLALK